MLSSPFPDDDAGALVVGGMTLRMRERRGWPGSPPSAVSSAFRWLMDTLLLILATDLRLCKQVFAVFLP